MGSEVKIKDVMRAIQENVFDGPSLFSNNARTMKNFAIIALTTAGKFIMMMNAVKTRFCKSTTPLPKSRCKALV